MTQFPAAFTAGNFYFDLEYIQHIFMAVRNRKFSFTKNSLQLITGGVFFITLSLLPQIISSSNRHQMNIASAAPSTNLYFMPKTDSENLLITKPGDTIKLDIYMNPGTNLPYVTKLKMRYDPLVFEAKKDSINIDRKIFPKILDGPFVNDGNISITMSVGSDPDSVLKNITKIGTLELTVKSSNGGEISRVSLGKETLILSMSESSFPSENMLESTIPAHIKVMSGFADRNEPNYGILNLNVYLEGMGEKLKQTSDNKFINNESPRHPDKKAEVTIYNNAFERIMEMPGFISYNPAKGVFQGMAFFEKPIANDQYYIKLRIPGYADKTTNRTQKIASGQENEIDPFFLNAGDINLDNLINALDYNIMRNCMDAVRQGGESQNNYDFRCDLNDDQKVNQTDLELLHNGLSILSNAK